MLSRRTRWAFRCRCRPCFPPSRWLRRYALVRALRRGHPSSRSQLRSKRSWRLPSFGTTRDAMGIVLAAHDRTLVLPGSPALRCTFASTRGPMGSVAGVSIDCGGARLAATSKRDLLRLINDGELHRQMALTTASNVELLGAALGLAIDPEISPLRSENQIRILALRSGRFDECTGGSCGVPCSLQGETSWRGRNCVLNRMTIDMESFRDLGSPRSTSSGLSRRYSRPRRSDQVGSVAAPDAGCAGNLLPTSDRTRG